MNFKILPTLSTVALTFFALILAISAIGVFGDVFQGKAEYDPSFLNPSTGQMDK